MAENPQHIELTALCQDNQLRMAQFLGRSDLAYVVFSGVGTNPHSHPPFEFVRSTLRGGENSALFISERSRSWYNAPGFADRVEAQVRSFLSEANAKRVVYLGHSMGAFNAIQLSRSIPADRVIALSPQFSVDPSLMPGENRWRRFTSAIPEFVFRDLSQVPQGKTDFVVIHGDGPGEIMHWQPFPKQANIMHFILQGRGHSFPQRLKDTGILGRVIRLASDGRDRRLRQLIAKLGGVSRHRYEAEVLHAA